MESRENIFVLTPTKWVRDTNAIGLKPSSDLAYSKNQIGETVFIQSRNLLKLYKEEIHVNQWHLNFCNCKLWCLKNIKINLL